MLEHRVGGVMSEIMVVSTTLPSDMTESAVHTFIMEFIETNLAACAQHHLVNSIYSWKGDVVSEREWRIIFKTSESRLTHLIDAIEEKHPYEVPQINWVSERATKSYRKWVESLTKG